MKGSCFAGGMEGIAVQHRRAIPGALFGRLAPAMKRVAGMRAQETPTREPARFAA